MIKVFSRSTSYRACYSWYSVILHWLHFSMEGVIITLVVNNIHLVKMGLVNALYIVTKDCWGKKTWSLRSNPVVLFTSFIVRYIGHWYKSKIAMVQVLILEVPRVKYYPLKNIVHLKQLYFLKSKKLVMISKSFLGIQLPKHKYLTH